MVCVIPPAPGQSRWGPSSPGRAVGGAGDQPPWSQPSQPKPLFPVSHSEEPPPPPPPRARSKDPSPQAAEGEGGRGGGGRMEDWREREEGRDTAGMYRGEKPIIFYSRMRLFETDGRFLLGLGLSEQVMFQVIPV